MDLPTLFPFHGDWPTYVEELYKIYMNDIVNGQLHYEGLQIRYRFNPMDRGKGYGFWHIIQEGSIEEERQPDIRRCERILWIPWIIKQAKNYPYISYWEEIRGSETNILLWLEKENYLVILEKRSSYYLLKSAYWTNRPHKIATLRKNRDAYWRGRKS